MIQYDVKHHAYLTRSSMIEDIHLIPFTEPLSVRHFA